jgi:hypothetical protein
MSLLHSWGDLLRELLMRVPLEAARVLFVLFNLALLLWVLRLPKSQTQPSGSRRPSLAENLKLWAALTLLIQILIYSFL